LPTITGASTLACLLAASISVETVTPPLVGIGLVKNHFQSRSPWKGSQITDLADEWPWIASNLR